VELPKESLMPDDTARLNVRKAHSNAKDAAQAVAELARGLEQPGASVVAFFASSSYDLQSLAEEMSRRFRVPLIGCTTSGEIAPTGYAQGTLTGFSLASRELETHTYLIPSLKDIDSLKIEGVVDSVLDRLSRVTKDSPEARAFGLLLVDGLSVKEEEVIALLANALRDLPIIGGSAGDDLRLDRTFVYHDGRFISDAALFSLFITTLPFRLIKTQHFVASDRRLVITGATPENRLVHEINGLPAAEEYARIIGKSVGELTPTVFSEYPLMLRLGGQYYVRSIQRVNEDQSLTFFCAIDEGLVLRLARGENLVENLRDAFTDVREEIPNIKLTIGCDCILRRLEVVDKKLEDPVNAILTLNNVIGFSTYGEQFQSVHINQTFTGVAIGE
jgi:hypothetical protein